MLLVALQAAQALGPESAAEGPADARSEAAAGPGTGKGASPEPGRDRPSGWGPTRGEIEAARDLVADMPLGDQAAAVLMPGFWGSTATSALPAEADRNRDMHEADTVAAALDRTPYGGIFLRPEVIADATQVHDLVDGLRAPGDSPGGLPLLVSIDQEGGSVQRLREGVTALPSAATVGQGHDRALARRIARVNGTELRALGVTMAFAPVADLAAGNPTIGSRAFSSDPEAAAAMVTASVAGFLDAGVVPVVKHFPGHGSVTGDSHHSLPVQRKPLSELTESDLVPFQAAIDAGAPAVMTAHVAVEDLQPGMPASLSPRVVQGLLRDRMHFEGVAVTDSQGMGPVHGRFGPAAGAVRSLLAGNDLVLNSPDPQKAREAVVHAVRSGRLPQSRLSDAATRVLALRLYQQRIGGDRPDIAVLGSPEHLAAVETVGG